MNNRHAFVIMSIRTLEPPHIQKGCISLWVAIYFQTIVSCTLAWFQLLKTPRYSYRGFSEHTGRNEGLKVLFPMHVQFNEQGCRACSLP